MRQILSDDGLTQTHLVIQGDELVTADVTPGNRIQKILDVNNRHRIDGVRENGLLRPAASIDPVIYMGWKRDWRENHRDKWTWKTYLVMKLNSRDFSYFRTQDSKIGLTSQDRG